MRIHLISIGGAAMHNIAIALKNNGHIVSGSDDEIYEPSKSRLINAQLFPNALGWDSNRITNNIDFIILGMHAKLDNPELLKAQEEGIRIYSYPSFVYEHSKNKKRIVIAGSHGKTTTTSMIMHVLNDLKFEFDYLVGAQVEGFDCMARFSEAPIIVIEGDEYLSSPLDRKPKMLHYMPHIAVITGIAWDHINVFPSFELYKEQFLFFIKCIKDEGKLYYYQQDEIEDLVQISNTTDTVQKSSYRGLQQSIKGNVYYDRKEYPLDIFGRHNMQNLDAALRVCLDLGIEVSSFFQSMKTFNGAAKRLQLLAENNKKNTRLYLDFAHAPSKVKATTNAVKERYPHQSLTAVLELHTYSSLDPSFIDQYKGSLEKANVAIVYVDRHTIEMKGKQMIENTRIIKAFDLASLIVINDRETLEQCLANEKLDGATILLMSSGNFGGMNLNILQQRIENE